VKVPILDLSRATAELQGELHDALLRVVDSGRFILGPEGAAFEEEFAHYVGARHCVGVGSGLGALELALRALGVGAGDEVIVPGFTYVATWLGVTLAGATPVPVEPDPVTYNVDPARIEAAITTATKAILPVHLYGQAADMAAIVEVAERHGLMVLEDAAQSHGARDLGRRTGALGDAAAWSFYPSKNLGAFGDAGAVTTDDAQLAEALRELRNYGAVSRYRHDRVGANSRMDELQAAVLRTKLVHLDDWNARRQDVARTYLGQLASSAVTLPGVRDQAEHVWHLFVVRAADRDGMVKHLAAREIGTEVHYPIPPHLDGPYAGLGHRVGSLPLTEALSESVLSIPIGPHMTPDEVAAVIEGVGSWVP
jgi:dTDP-4-amino-4,6-dideoxygalactose transaminase